MKQTLPAKRNLALRLSGYAASAGALIAIGSTANGQVVYSGLQNMEVNMPDEYMEIDLDGDLVNDFGFVMYGYSTMGTFPNGYYVSRFGYGVILNPKTDSYNNSWMIRSTFVSALSSTGTYPIVHGLSEGIDVNSSQTMWSDMSYPYWPGGMGIGNITTVFYTYPVLSTIQSYWGVGDFIGTENYIGIRFYIGTEQHYGWIRASMGNELEPMTIIDWAYESTPGIGITTGLPVIGFSGVEEVVSEATQTLSITFSEEVTGFEIGDIIVTNGTSANLVEVTAGLEYTVEITAHADGEVGVEIGADAVNDLAANGNAAAETNWLYDSTPPTVTLDPGVSGTTHDQTVTVSVEFSEEISGLGLSEFVITNGTASNLAVVIPRTEFSVDITAAADGDVTVTLPAGAVTDVAGNDNTEASTTYTYEEPVNNLNNLSEEGIKIYPNPVDDNLHIELESESMVRILNINGTIFYQKDRVLNEIIEMNDFTPGIYIVQIENGEKVTQHKLIVE